MHDDCLAAVEEALGRSLRAGEARTIEDAVSLQMRLLARKDPQAWMALPQDERLNLAAKAAADSMLADVKWRQRNVQLQIQAHDRIENTLAGAFDALPDTAKAGDRLRTVSQLLAFDTRGKGIASAESWAHAIRAEAYGELIPLWKSVKGNFFGLFESPEGVRDLVKEIYGEDSGNAVAKVGAEAWFKVTDSLRDRANAAGQRIGELEDWHLPQAHSQERVAAAGLDKWAGDILPLLDRNKYLNADGIRMSDQQMLERVLPSAFDSIITDGVNKMEPGSTGYGVVANRNAGHRSLFFKDSESFLNYQGQYGDRSLWPTLTGHINRLSRDIGLLETLGPNARETFNYFNDRTRLDELRMYPEAAAKVSEKHSFNQSLYDYVSGNQKVVNQKIADGFQAFRNFEVATKLGQVVITALGDEAGMASTAFANRVPWTDSLMRELKYLNPANAEDRATAMHAGLGLNGMIGGLNRFGSEDFGGEGASTAAKANQFTGRLANWVLHASGAEAMWDARRQALGSVLMSYLGKITREVENFSDINETDHGVLARKGVTENDWAVWKKAEPEDWGMQHGVLTPKSVWSVPDTELAPLGDPTALKRHAATMLLSHVLEETGMGVMDSGARERTSLTFGTQRGSYGGELTRSAMLFKGFAASMMMKHWGRAGTMESGADRFNYVARLITVGTIAAAAANQLRALAAGKNPENMADPRFWGSAVLRGGGLGFYGDFLYAELTQHDTSLVPALMGPLATETEGIWNLTGAAAFKTARGERVDEGAKLVRYARGNIPFLNMWYTKAAMDHILWNNMQEAVSPGYLDRMQARAYDTAGTTYYWDPHEKTPVLPNVATAWNPQEAQQRFQAQMEKVERPFE